MYAYIRSYIQVHTHLNAHSTESTTVARCATILHTPVPEICDKAQHVHLYICLYAYIHSYIQVRTYLNAHWTYCTTQDLFWNKTGPFPEKYAFTYVCMHICVYLCVYVCVCSLFRNKTSLSPEKYEITCVCMHICVYVCLYVCM